MLLVTVFVLAADYFLSSLLPFIDFGILFIKDIFRNIAINNLLRYYTQNQSDWLLDFLSELLFSLAPWVILELADHQVAVVVGDLHDLLADFLASLLAHLELHRRLDREHLFFIVLILGEFAHQAFISFPL